jgi:hypothetical protein
VSKNHFLTIYRPFPAIYRMTKSGENAGFATPVPFSAARKRLRNGETAEMAAAQGPVIFAASTLSNRPCH